MHVDVVMILSVIVDVKCLYYTDIIMGGSNSDVIDRYLLMEPCVLMGC